MRARVRRGGVSGLWAAASVEAEDEADSIPVIRRAGALALDRTVIFGFQDEAQRLAAQV
jgi:hypothetical protein